MYEPSAFTHQRGVLQPAHCFYNRDMPYPGDPERYRDHARETGLDPRRFDGFAEIGRDFLADVLRDAFDWKAAHPGRILWCGEFGTIRHARPAWREAWMRDVTSLLREHGVPWCVWNYLSTPNDGNRFSLVDDDTRLSIQAVLPKGATGVSIEGVDRSMDESTVLATATLSAGGEQSYLVTLVRDGLGWKVSSVTVEYPSLDGEQPSLDTGEPTDDATAVEGEAAEGDSGASTATGSL